MFRGKTIITPDRAIQGPTRRVFLTGASGFIGRHILLDLVARGVEVHAVSRKFRPSTNSVTWHMADLRDPSATRALVQQIDPTHILHSAWDVTPGKFWNDPGNLDWATGSLALVSAAGTLGARFVGVGTCAEYDWTNPVLSEASTPIVPLTPYGRAKAMVWDHASKLRSAAWGRVFMPYGPGDNPRRLIPSVIASLRTGGPIDLTSGTQERDFIFAPDVGRFFADLLLSDRTGAFNVGTGVATSIRSVVERVADTLGADRKLLYFGARPENGEPPKLVADTAKLKASGLDTFTASAAEWPSAAAFAYIRD